MNSTQTPDWRNMPPEEIERRSFEIISEELGGTELSGAKLAVLKRVIHTTADFEYAKTLYFSPEAVTIGMAALRAGAHILTDTKMAEAGINKTSLAKLGGMTHCFMADEDVRIAAKREGITRAAVSMGKACGISEPLIIAVGNAPTALLRLRELILEKQIKPELIIGVPVGFVNVVESKAAIKALDIPCIIAQGRKGGSTVAAAICNALLYQTEKFRGMTDVTIRLP